MAIINAEDVNFTNIIEHNKKLQDLKAKGVAAFAGRIFNVTYYNIKVKMNIISRNHVIYI